MNHRRLLIIVGFFVLIILGYKLVEIEGGVIEKDGRSESDFLEKSNLEINLLISQIREKYLSYDELIIEKRSLSAASAEGGEIVRYNENKGNTLRYKLTYYGEVGLIEENYYIMKNNNIYYSRLEEIYSSPIYLKQETDILYRIFIEGITVDGKFCYYDKSNINLEEIGSTEEIYKSLEELNILFDSAESE